MHMVDRSIQVMAPSYSAMRFAKQLADLRKQWRRLLGEHSSLTERRTSLHSHYRILSIQDEHEEKAWLLGNTDFKRIATLTRVG